MNWLIINHSDSKGGAAVASMRLLEALSCAGESVRMLVSDRRTTGTAVEQAGNWLTRGWHFLAERATVVHEMGGIYRDRLFAVDPATQGEDIARHPAVAWADVIVLGWINQGTMSLEGIGALVATGKPVLWVMHDMWNMTGVCHVTGSCSRYTTQCIDCPLLHPNGVQYPGLPDLATSTWQRKAALYSAPNLQFIAVSNWLMSCCRMSALMRAVDITVIPNTIDVKSYNPSRLNDNMWGDLTGKVVMCYGAARIDDPVKGLPLLTAATQYIARALPALARRLHLLFYGGIRDMKSLDGIAIDHTYVGYVADPREVYRRADVVLSASEVESFGYTLLEGLACGCVPVTTGGGGQRDIVTHLVNGYVAAGNAVDFARGIGWAADCRLDRNALHRSTVAFDYTTVARRFTGLFTSSNSLQTGTAFKPD